VSARGELPAALSNPDLYPGVRGPVEVRETHISWVFLAGDRAYKLKKPLVLPFLDYGTAARRLEMCREEVRLNRRLAGDLYLGVRAVARGPAGFELADEEDERAVDYVVEMRRYDERRTLAARVEGAEVTPGGLARELVSLARLIAGFHAKAERVAPEEWVPAVRARLAQNFSELDAVLGSASDAQRVRALQRFSDAFLAIAAERFEERARSGRVVEGHGDLRADHVLLDGVVRVVDCIEFDRRMRELDVADELAFLQMDLSARGGEALARCFIDAYREAGGDPGPPRLIAFYACFRALVRAKVAFVRARQEPVAGALQGGEGAAAARLLALAERFAWESRLPLVAVICGVPASGKSHLARRLASASGLPRLSSDVVRKRDAGVRTGERAPRAAYAAAVNRRTYLELGAAAAQEARNRGGALVDATFRHRADRDAFREAFANAAPLVFVECAAPPEVLAERARRRDAEPASESDASLPIVVREQRRWEPLSEIAPGSRTKLRSERPLADQLAAVSTALDRVIAPL
jgi:aminoglycoside phosphotransferase family enzyme/predicted kinase